MLSTASSTLKSSGRFLITSLLGLCLEWDRGTVSAWVGGIKQWVRQLQDECSCLVMHLLCIYLCVCDMLATLYLHNDRLRTSEWLLWLQTSQPHSKTGHRERGMFFRGNAPSFYLIKELFWKMSLPDPLVNTRSVPASRPNTEKYITQLHRYR